MLAACAHCRHPLLSLAGRFCVRRLAAPVALTRRLRQQARFNAALRDELLPVDEERRRSQPSARSTLRAVRDDDHRDDLVLGESDELEWRPVPAERLVAIVAGSKQTVAL